MAEVNSGYTQSQIAAMQRDAVRRVNEMQKMSRERLLNGTGMPAGSMTPPPVAKRQEPRQSEQEDPPVEQCETEVVSSGLAGILDRLHLDSEMILIMLLLLVLVNEGADVKLILALVYIML